MSCVLYCQAGVGYINCTSSGQVVGGIGCPAVTDRCTVRWSVLIQHRSWAASSVLYCQAGVGYISCTSSGQVVGGIGCPVVTGRCTVRWGVLI